MGAAVVGGDDLEILMPRAAVSILVLDPGVREPHMPIVVRQLVFPHPTRNLFGLTVRPAVAVLLASIALMEKSLIVALQLVVEDDAPDPAASVPQSLLRALVGAIDLGVVRQLARLSEAGVERLARLAGAFVSLVPIRFEQVAAAVCQDDGAVVGTERAGPNQSLALEMSNAPTRTIGLVAQVVQIALGDDPERADGPKHAALGAVDLVDAVTVPHRPALPAAWQVDVLREHIARVAVGRMIAFAAPATAAAASVPEVVAVAVI